jgi:lysophospholipase L1-like esterase
MRILIRGGSIAAGHGVLKGYADILKEKLSASGIELINRSRYRETSFEGVWTFDEDIEPFRPDILLLNFGIDDAFRPVYRSEFQENHVRMIRRARKLFNPRIVLATSHTFDDPYEMDAVNIYYRSLRIVAKDLLCDLVPIDFLWAGYIFEKGLISSELCLADARYPNERGHELFADFIYDYLKV